MCGSVKGVAGVCVCVCDRHREIEIDTKREKHLAQTETLTASLSPTLCLRVSCVLHGAGMRVRGAVTTAVYKKALTLSVATKKGGLMLDPTFLLFSSTSLRTHQVKAQERSKT